jgi:phage terminase Nu1 subunit (DNA packaging protein)
MAEGITGQSLAGLLDLDIRSITELARSGIVLGSGVRGRYLLAPSVRNYVRHLREIAAGRQGNELNAVDENARLKMAQHRNMELKNARSRASSYLLTLLRRHGAPSPARLRPRSFPSRRGAKRKCRICRSRTSRPSARSPIKC